MGVAALASAIVTGVTATRAGRKEREALASAGAEAKTLGVQERGDILAKNQRELKLYRDKFTFEKSEAEKDRKVWERKYATEDRQRILTNTINIINNNAELKSKFASLAVPKRGI